MQTREEETTYRNGLGAGEEPLGNIVNGKYKGRRVKTRSHANGEMIHT